MPEEDPKTQYRVVEDPINGVGDSILLVNDLFPDGAVLRTRQAKIVDNDTVFFGLDALFWPNGSISYAGYLLQGRPVSAQYLFYQEKKNESHKQIFPDIFGIHALRNYPIPVKVTIPFGIMEYKYVSPETWEVIFSMEFSRSGEVLSEEGDFFPFVHIRTPNPPISVGENYEILIWINPRPGYEAHTYISYDSTGNEWDEINPQIPYSTIYRQSSKVGQETFFLRYAYRSIWTQDTFEVHEQSFSFNIEQN